ncbi:hypothetical protein [Actinoplanes utahensis]|uniref:Uncharacterized protein n=1 Tax=Actinoplanes utahensis TaxID=1869 RepID=A0A0A6X0B6_ACTUT|nr:hypothetical protein [Actinoplanes utahensis]KHD73457.1 hypothetical protein MB27_35260 [Actinoplanes utahensis]GIF30248.1 hypothetical protein Aut01nite_32340 [Actinoplanes utahensis]
MIRRDGRSPGFALELVPVAGADLRRDYRRLTRAPDEPLRYRLTLPSDPQVALRVEQAVQLFAPHLWQGVRHEQLDIGAARRRLGKG